MVFCFAFFLFGGGVKVVKTMAFQDAQKAENETVTCVTAVTGVTDVTVVAN
jgi:hypothetical protein